MFVLYNEDEPLKVTQLKLSDAYQMIDDKINLELLVDVIDVNHLSAHEILDKSPSLKGYSQFIHKIKTYIKSGHTRDKAIGLAIDTCIKENILKDFLINHYEEVAQMLHLQYNAEDEKMPSEKRRGRWQKSSFNRRLSKELNGGLNVASTAKP